MVVVLQLIVITSILVLGYTISTQENMVFYGIRKWAEKKDSEGKKWASPIFMCHWCQPSSFSIISFLVAFKLGIIHKFEWQLLFIYILNVCGSSLLNGLIWGFNQKQNAQKEYYESAKITQELMADEMLGHLNNEEKGDELFEKNQN